jgi:hypothetical protein
MSQKQKRDKYCSANIVIIKEFDEEVVDISERNMAFIIEKPEIFPLIKINVGSFKLEDS